MGYFKTRFSRQRCSAQVAAAVSRQARAALNGWLPVPASPPPTRPAVYLRFAVSRTHPVSHRPLGIFQAAYETRARCGRDSDTGRALSEALRWFERNLRAPDVGGRFIYWFQSDAHECLRQVWQIIHVLREQDEVVWMMRCERPGKIRYRDRFQVAAVPGRWSPCTSRPV